MYLTSFLIRTKSFKKWRDCEAQLMGTGDKYFLLVRLLTGEENDRKPIHAENSLFDPDAKLPSSSYPTLCSDNSTLFDAATLTSQASIGPVSGPGSFLYNLREYKTFSVSATKIDGIGYFILNMTSKGLFGQQKDRICLASEHESIIAAWYKKLQLIIEPKETNSARRKASQASVISEPIVMHTGKVHSQNSINNCNITKDNNINNVNNSNNNNNNNNNVSSNRNSTFASSNGNIINTTNNSATGKAQCTSNETLMPLKQVSGEMYDSECMDAEAEPSDEMDDEMMQNDFYEPYTAGQLIRAEVEKTEAAVALKLPSCVILKPDVDSIYMLNCLTEEVLHRFPYNRIRKYGSNNGYFRIVAGRRCTTGEGQFGFKTAESDALVNYISKAGQQQGHCAEEIVQSQSRVYSVPEKSSTHMFLAQPIHINKANSVEHPTEAGVYDNVQWPAEVRGYGRAVEQKSQGASKLASFSSNPPLRRIDFNQSYHSQSSTRRSETGRDEEILKNLNQVLSELGHFESSTSLMT